MIWVENVTLFVFGQNRPRKVFRDVLSLFQAIKKIEIKFKVLQRGKPMV